MSLSKAFWGIFGINLVLVTIYLMGYQILPAIILLLIMDIMLLEINRHIDDKNNIAEFSRSVHSRITNMERILQNASYYGGHGDIEIHKTELRGEFKDSMDRLAKKLIEIENKMADMRRTMGAVAGVFEDRLAEQDSL